MAVAEAAPDAPIVYGESAASRTFYTIVSLVCVSLLTGMLGKHRKRTTAATNKAKGIARDSLNDAICGPSALHMCSCLFYTSWLYHLSPLQSWLRAATVYHPRLPVMPP